MNSITNNTPHKENVVKKYLCACIKVINILFNVLNKIILFLKLLLRKQNHHLQMKIMIILLLMEIIHLHQNRLKMRMKR